MTNLLTQFTNMFIFSLFSTICDRSLSSLFPSPLPVPPMLFLFLDYADLFLVGRFSVPSCWPPPVNLCSH